MSDTSGRNLARRVERDSLGRLLVANITGAVLVFAYLSLITPLGDTLQSLVTPTVALVVFLAVSFALGFLRTRRLFVTLRRWLQEPRRPTDAERRTVLAGPLALARVSLVYWLLAALVFTGLNYLLFAPEVDPARIGVTIVAGGLVTSSLVFLLTERTFRPVFALALAGDAPSGTPTPGLWVRLAAAWALGSAVPLLAIGAALVRWIVDGVPMTAPAAFLVIIGLLVGALITYATARSLVEPVEAVRAGLERVQRGDLDFEVTVDDGGEIGRLQAGFNQMVAGMREREQIRDLFGRHVGADVAHEAIRRGIRLGGERRNVSVMFCDLMGSTALAAQLDPDQLVAMLNDFFEAVVQVVEAEQGWVNKFEGDGALCVFGAPVELPDHPRRALRAARKLREALAELSDMHPSLDAGIGVSSGAVVAGNVGALRRFEYTVVGDPVNEAARLTELAKSKPGRVLASSASVGRADDEACNWASPQPVALRGRREPSAACELRPARDDSP